MKSKGASSPLIGDPLGITMDSNFVIDILRLDRVALAKANDLDRRREPKFLTTPVLYEISAGLLFTGSRSETAAFRSLASRFALLPFDEASAMKAAEIRAELMRLGRVKGHVDIMIAGIAAQGGHTLVTRDRDLHEISRTIGLNVEGY